MDRLTLLNMLKDELEENIKSEEDNCKSDISEIQHGDHSPDDTVNRPFIGLIALPDKVDKDFFSDGLDQLRKQDIHIYGYMESDGLGNYDDMFQMIEDITYFLVHKFSYKHRVHIGDVIPYQNGISMPMAVFDMYITIDYDYNI